MLAAAAVQLELEVTAPHTRSTQEYWESRYVRSDREREEVVGTSALGHLLIIELRTSGGSREVDSSALSVSERSAGLRGSDIGGVGAGGSGRIQ